MHELDNGYRYRYNKKEMDRMFKTYTDNSYKCSCGHTIAIAKSCEKIVCSYCGRYVFREKKDEFKYRLKEVM
ncbi:hypothetical protein [Fusobacterium ulcerans]|uniref:hypothetical protein n=1 Tax=Fusobacterium ulcerans TaxID=861 RepID=UPI002E7A39A5|nr:hypothetical protein [Fusobacterium ulcerans]MEE0137739.1 hypothetical protein [Fusobacterium ulcerans]